ncbi:MAG: hypothetical protein IJM75_05880 [Ruminococcus sp.]|nr:hypothetical protein [Ruminococcus sp.]
MDRFESIFNAIGGFIRAGIFLLPLIAGVIFLIWNAKRPKLDQMKRNNNMQQQYQQGYNQGQYQGQQYQQGQFQQGQYYGYGNTPPMPPYPYPPAQPPKKTGSVVKLVVGALIGYYVVLPIVGALLIFTLIFTGVRSCERQREENYQRALEDVSISAKSDLPETIDMGSCKLTKQFSSEYDLERRVGDCLVLANRKAEGMTHGSSLGFLVLTDLNGKLITEEGEFYSHIGLSSGITCEGEEVIICTKTIAGNYYTPRSEEFEEQEFYTQKGKKVRPKKLEYDKNSFSSQTACNDPDRTTVTEAVKDDSTYVEGCGTAYLTDKFLKGEDACPQELLDKKAQADMNKSYVIRKQGGEILFPKNASFETVYETNDINFILQGQIYHGDIYKQIFDYDINEGWVSAARYDPKSGVTSLGLFDLDGNELYKPILTGIHFDNSKVFVDDYTDELSFRIGDLVAFKNEYGFDIVNTKGEKLRDISGNHITVINDDLFTVYKDAPTVLTLGSFTHPEKDILLTRDTPAAFIELKADEILIISQGELKTYYMIK